MKKNLLGVSLLTMSFLYGILSAIIILIFLLTDLPVIYGIIISIIVLILQFLISPFITDLTMKWIYKAKFNYELPEYLNDFVKNICSKYNMKYPKIGYIDDGAPNAFTYGRTKNDARIIITRGILELLNEEEVKSVVAHELGHATHYDMLFMTVAQVVPLVLYGIYELTTKSDSKSNDSNNSNLALIGIIAYALYIISQYIILFLSRTREYYADNFALEETKNPNALAEALVKIGYGLSTSSNSENGNKSIVSHSNALGIFDSKTSKTLVVTSSNENDSKQNIQNAMKWENWNIWAKLYELNSTHPLISKRLKAISSRCQEFNQEPYIDFNIQKEESYVDDFFIEILINFLPLLSIIFTLLIMILNPVYSLLILGIGGTITMLLSFLKLSFVYKNKNYNETKVSNLLGEVKVSGITSIPCTLEGEIIGRGNPGCILNEDFVLKDETGIMLLDYNQPLNIINTVFALFKSKEYFGKRIKVKGWYRRSPVPYVEIYTMEIDGIIKKCHTYSWAKAFRIIGLIFFIIIFLLSLI